MRPFSKVIVDGVFYHNYVPGRITTMILLLRRTSFIVFIAYHQIHNHSKGFQIFFNTHEKATLAAWPG